jgi:hypothetical protein
VVAIPVGGGRPVGWVKEHGDVPIKCKAAFRRVRYALPVLHPGFRFPATIGATEPRVSLKSSFIEADSHLPVNLNAAYVLIFTDKKTAQPIMAAPSSVLPDLVLLFAAAPAQEGQ